MQYIDTPFEVLLWAVGAVALVYLAYRFGRWSGWASSQRMMAQKEQELFTAQKGFKQLYEQELRDLRGERDELQARVDQMTAKVEDYRKKAAGFGGLFGSGGKKADAMYALLLENEALEEALVTQNEKLKSERTDSLKEQMRATGYRRVLMSQLLNDNRIKEYVAEILAEERHLPAPASQAASGANHGGPRALPHQGEEVTAAEGR